ASALKGGIEGSYYQALGSGDGLKRNGDFEDQSLQEADNPLQGKSVDLEAAIEVFQLNAAAYPRSAWVYLDLGKAYASKGSQELATRNLKKCLQLNPQISEARTILDWLSGQNDLTDD
ncbi:MAG: hypothetical protein AAF804_14170, partial [Bacteroidota bacterium]